MGRFGDLLACPLCDGTLSDAWRCSRCATQFDAPDDIPNLRLPGDARTEVVRGFYEHEPFPGYPPRDSLSALRARAERSVFARLVDRSIAADARIAEIGCGTGQMSLYLARADRAVVAVDLVRASLTLGVTAARRFGVRGVQFVETDLHRPGLRKRAFDVVYSSGVVHHTRDPRVSFGRMAQLVRPGGVVVLGVYNRWARLPSRARRAIARVSGYRSIPFDPILRARTAEPERRRAWLRDQYQHPEEHWHSVADVQQWFAENGIQYLRTYPSTTLEDDPPDLFSPACDNWAPENWLAQIGWMRTLGPEGGLFFTIGRRTLDQRAS